MTTRAIILLLPILAFSRCAPPPAPVGQARADAETLAACRVHADAVYNRNNRDTIYSISSRDSPYSANYTPGVYDHGLAQRYDHDNMIRDCVRNTGTETDRVPTTTPAPAVP